MGLIPFYKQIVTSEVKETVLKTLNSGYWSYGDVGKEFENRFTEYIGCKWGCIVPNCTLALRTAYKVLGIKQHDEVIIPSMTFTATANAIISEGGIPIFADIEAVDRPCISTADIEDRITDKTFAICIVHYGGYSCDMGKIVRIAKDNGLYLIEDCAHSIGSTYNGKKLGTFGDISCFSFYSIKNLPIGEGGFIATNDADIAESVGLYKYHGIDKYPQDRGLPIYDVLREGTNYKVPEILSAVALAQLRYVEGWNKIRRELTDLYVEQLGDTLKIPFHDYQYKSSCHLMPILLPEPIDRTKFIKDVKKVFGCSIHYLPVHKFTYYKKRFGDIHLEKTEYFGEHEISLPLYPLLSDEETIQISDTIKNTLRGKSC